MENYMSDEIEKNGRLAKTLEFLARTPDSYFVEMKELVQAIDWLHTYDWDLEKALEKLKEYSAEVDPQRITKEKLLAYSDDPNNLEEDLFEKLFPELRAEKPKPLSETFDRTPGG